MGPKKTTIYRSKTVPGLEHRRTTFYLETQEMRRLKEIAAREECKVNDLVRLACRQLLAREDRQSAARQGGPQPTPRPFVNMVGIRTIKGEEVAAPTAEREPYNPVPPRRRIRKEPVT
jgi:hypothetical protein